MDQEKKKQKAEESEEDEVNSRKEAKTEENEPSSTNTVNPNSSSRNSNETEEDDEEEDTPNVPTRANLLRFLLSSMQNRSDITTNAQLIISLKQKGLLKTKEIEEAFLKLPRNEFVTEDVLAEAFDDNPIRLTKFLFNVSAPHMYAICLESLAIQPGHHVLDIGSGCGHLTCIAGLLAGKSGKAIGLDLRQDIIDFSNANKKKVTEKFGADLTNVTFLVRNCFLPTFKKETYDRIHVGACCPDAKLDELIALLNPGGILVTPFGDRMVKIEKDKNGKCTTTKLMAVRYGDLVIPSDAEIVAAKKEIEKEKAKTILLPEDPCANQFEKLINNSDLSDIVLSVEGKTIQAHKVILAARSEFFKAMFYRGLKESKDSVIHLSDLSYAAFMDCLRYIYRGHLDIKDADHAIEILSAANYLKLDYLKALCEKIIAANIEVDTAAYSLGVAALTESWQLKSYCLSFIVEHFDEVSATKGFEELSKPLILEVTKEACKRNKM